MTFILASTALSFAASGSDVTQIQYQNNKTSLGNNDWKWFEGHAGDVTSNNTWNTVVRKLTKLKTADGKTYTVKGDDELSSSYLYCMEPGTQAPAENTWVKVENLDGDDASGRKAKVRKAVFYLYGSPGYGKVTKERWFEKYNGKSDTFALCHGLISYIYNSTNPKADHLDKTSMVSSRDKDWIKKWAADLANLPDPPEEFDIVIVYTGSKSQTLVGPLNFSQPQAQLKLKKASKNTSITG